MVSAGSFGELPGRLGFWLGDLRLPGCHPDSVDLIEPVALHGQDHELHRSAAGTRPVTRVPRPGAEVI
jgi:hypothetical protein